MRTWLVTLLAITLVVAACKPITPEGSVSADQEPRVVATETSKPTASETTTVDAAAEAVTSTQSAATPENVAPTETPQAPEAPTAELEPPAELVAFGHDTYRKQYCGICHELEVAGTTGTFGPPHNHMGIIAATRIQEPNYSGSATSAAEYLYESLVTPEIFIVDGYALTSHRMPAYSFLSEAELDALVAFLLVQK